MNSIKSATIGSVSHGTLRNPDLLDNLATELKYQVVHKNGHYYSAPENFAERDRLNKLFEDAFELGDAIEDGHQEDGGEASELVNTLMDELNRFAPEGCYFGAHPGDGSDFGYWQNEE